MASHFDEVLNMKPEGFLFQRPSKDDIDAMVREKIPNPVNKPGTIQVLSSFGPTDDSLERFFIKIITRKLTPKGKLDDFYVMVRMYCVSTSDPDWEPSTVFILHIFQKGKDLTAYYDQLPFELIQRSKESNPELTTVSALIAESRVCACCTVWNHRDDDDETFRFEEDEVDDDEEFLEPIEPQEEHIIYAGTNLAGMD